MGHVILLVTKGLTRKGDTKAKPNGSIFRFISSSRETDDCWRRCLNEIGSKIKKMNTKMDSLMDRKHNSCANKGHDINLKAMSALTANVRLNNTFS